MQHCCMIGVTEQLEAYEYSSEALAYKGEGVTHHAAQSSPAITVVA